MTQLRILTEIIIKREETKDGDKKGIGNLENVRLWDEQWQLM